MINVTWVFLLQSNGTRGRSISASKLQHSVKLFNVAAWKKIAHSLIKHQPIQWWQHALFTIHHILKNHILDHSPQNRKTHRIKWPVSHQHNPLCHVRPSNRRRSVFRPKTCNFQTCPYLASLSGGFWSAKWGRGFCLDRKDLAKASWSPETKKKD